VLLAVEEDIEAGSLIVVQGKLVRELTENWVFR
jgi:hypothetical protein